MKDKILMLIIGILIGAIITAGGFLLFGKKGKQDGKMNRKDFDTNMIGEDGGRRLRGRSENGIEEPQTKPESDDMSQTENT